MGSAQGAPLPSEALESMAGTLGLLCMGLFSIFFAMRP
jgi:hypothetical protein